MTAISRSLELVDETAVNPVFQVPDPVASKTEPPSATCCLFTSQGYQAEKPFLGIKCLQKFAQQLTVQIVIKHGALTHRIDACLGAWA